MTKVNIKFHCNIFLMYFVHFNPLKGPHVCFTNVHICSQYIMFNSKYYNFKILTTHIKILT